MLTALALPTVPIYCQARLNGLPWGAATTWLQELLTGGIMTAKDASCWARHGNKRLLAPLYNSNITTVYSDATAVQAQCKGIKGVQVKVLRCFGV